MTLQYPFILTVLQQVSTDRLQKAVNALVDGSMAIIITRKTETEIRALVKNGDGHEYGITLTPSLVTCSCKDALYRGVICKHVTTVALSLLRSSLHEAPHAHRIIHLVREPGAALCGVAHPAQFWQWPYWPETAWKESCGDCEAMRQQSILRRTTASA